MQATTQYITARLGRNCIELARIRYTVAFPVSKANYAITVNIFGFSLSTTMAKSLVVPSVFADSVRNLFITVSLTSFALTLSPGLKITLLVLERAVVSYHSFS